MGDTSFVIRFDSELNGFYPMGSITLRGPEDVRSLTRDDFQFTRGSQFTSLALGDLSPGHYVLRFGRWQFTDLSQNRTIDQGFSVTFEVVQPLAANEFNFDLDGDGNVDGNDLALLQEAGRWRETDLKFDLNGDSEVGISDVAFLLQAGLGSRFGDTNLDGQFDSSDLVQIFRHGTFGRRATWETGDFTGDGLFDSDDLVLAFQHGTYSKLDPVAVAAALDDDFDR
jgi:hypothetical protein